MTFFDFINKRNAAAFRVCILLLLSAGISNALVIAIINTGASLPVRGSLVFAFWFLASVAAAASTQYYATSRSAALIERSLHDVRLELVDAFLKSDLQPLENLGMSAVYSCFARDTLVLGQASYRLAWALQAFASAIVILLYLMFVSPAAGWLIVAMLLAGAVVWRTLGSAVERTMAAAGAKNESLLDLAAQTLDGFKEVKLNQARAAALEAAFLRVAAGLELLQKRLNETITRGPLFLQVLFYVLLGVSVFLLPKLHAVNTIALHKITAAVLFVMGPVTGVFVALPFVAIANASVGSIGRLRDRLALGAGAGESQAAPVPSFESLHLSGLEFRYGEDPGDWFQVGPINFKLQAGELVFIAGGNGSGKSTFLKLLTGLYYPVSGRIEVNGAPVDPDDYGPYRGLFSAIFPDFHVFEKLYGLSVDEGLVDSLLRRFDLHHKTRLSRDGWTSRELSTGQKKRLAMIVARLEDRPLLVLDEWAADQDPEFRSTFYREILPELKKAGKTMVVATHDDRYFDAADRVYKMELGMLSVYGDPSPKAQQA